jgi:hypothetical protein
LLYLVHEGDVAFGRAKALTDTRWSAFFILIVKEIAMKVVEQRSTTGKILDNIVYLAEVFGDRDEKDIPKIPVLEMARCFDLAPPPVRTTRRRSRDWPLWN